MKQLLTIISCFVVLSMGAQVPGYVNEQGLMAWYSMNGSSEDDSGNGNHLIADGEVIWADFEGNQFCDFSGEGQFLYHPDYTWPSTPELSIVLWVRMDQFSTGSNIGTIRPILSKHFSSSNGSFILLSREEEFVFAHQFEVPNSVDLSQWHHIAVCWGSSGLAQAYFDGLQVFEGIQELNLTAHPFLVGGWLPCGYTSYSNCDAGLSFDGGVYDLGLWNRALGVEEILALYEKTPNVFGCTNPSACNFNVDATQDDGSCDFFTCLCLDGTIWSEELAGCIPTDTCEDDLDGDGAVGVNDLMQLLSSFGTNCPLVEPAEWTCGDPVSYHGYDYETVLIGEQCWFAENLRTELYQNGDSIPGGLSDEEWVSVNTGASAVYEDDSSNLEIFGSLYNWYATSDQRNLCPNEWHVPSLQECELLVEYLGEQSTAASMMKSTEFETPPWDGLNNSGFSAVPGGQRLESWGYFNIGICGEHWTSSSPGPSTGYDMRLYTESDDVQFTSGDRHIGNSVRCIKDTEE